VKKADGSVRPVSTEKIAALEAGAVVTVKSGVFTPTEAELLTLMVEADTEGTVKEVEDNNNNISRTFFVERNDHALGKPITASTGNAPLANDADAGSYWQATASPATITVDLGAVQQVSQVRLSEHPTWATPRNMTLEILASSDGSTFTPIVAPKAYSIRGNAPASIDFAPAPARFVRLNITASKPNMAELAKFQVYGEPVGSAVSPAKPSR
jgi:hypothetical protein